MKEAVTIRRELDAARPDAFRPALVISLNNLAGSLAALGRREEALDAIDEAVIYRELAAAQPDAFRPDLARSLSNLSGPGRPGAAGGGAGCRRPGCRHVPGTGRRPAGRVPARPRGSLNNQSAGWRTGRREEALAAVDEAVAIYRELAAAQPDAFRPDLATR